jgi:hypothetical protein
MGRFAFHGSPLPMSQIVSTVPAMLLVLVLMTLAGSPSSMTCTGCLAVDDNEAGPQLGVASAARAARAAWRCALRSLFGHCLAPSVQTAMSVCEIRIEQPHRVW